MNDLARLYLEHIVQNSKKIIYKIILIGSYVVFIWLTNAKEISILFYTLSIIFFLTILVSPLDYNKKFLNWIQKYKKYTDMLWKILNIVFWAPALFDIYLIYGRIFK